MVATAASSDSATSGASSAPGDPSAAAAGSSVLNPVLNALRANEENLATVFRKAIRDTLVTPQLLPPQPTYRPITGSRRGSGTGNTAVLRSGSPASLVGNVYGQQHQQQQQHHHQHHASNIFTALSLGPFSSTATPTGAQSSGLLAHQRRQYDSAHPSGPGALPVPACASMDHSTPGAGPLSSQTTAAATGMSHGSPMIQKNPTHIAALQVRRCVAHFYRCKMDVYGVYASSNMGFCGQAGCSWGVYCERFLGLKNEYTQIEWNVTVVVLDMFECWGIF